MKRVLLWLAAALVAGCSTSKPGVPPLAGPSELALSLAVTASPDLISQDGQSQSLLTVIARGPNGQALRGVSMRLNMFVGGTNVDYGTLSTKSISTDNNGQASAIYTAPLPPPPTVTSDTTVNIQIVPVGLDYGNTTSRWVSIHLARPGVIHPPNPPVVPSFFASPSEPHENESVQFDASASTGRIVSYAWTFGDGSSGTGVRPTHVYEVAGVYNVMLTVTDDQQVQASTPATPITVIAAANPVASFVISPADPLVWDMVYLDASASTVPAGRSIVDYRWNFGDGVTGSGRTPTHQWGKAGTYTVTLTVTDSTGRTGVSSKSLQVK